MPPAPRSHLAPTSDLQSDASLLQTAICEHGVLLLHDPWGDGLPKHHFVARWADNTLTYIKTSASEKFSVYEMKDGKPDLVNYDLREGTYILPKVMDSGYVELGKKRMGFSRKR